MVSQTIQVDYWTFIWKVLAGTIWNLQIQDMATPHMARGSLPHLEALDSFKLLHATPNSIRI